MHTEIEKEETGEVRYTQITIPARDFDKYKANGWELVEQKENNLFITIRKPINVK